MAQRALPQSKEALLKSYNKRLKDDVKSLLDNFSGKNVSFKVVIGKKLIFVLCYDILIEIIKLARVEEETQVSRMTQCEEDHFEMLVRASNIVNFINSFIL